MTVRRRQMSAARTIALVLVALATAALLDAGNLVRLAEQQPYGLRRDLALRIMGPVERVSELLALDRPRRGLAAAVGRTPAPHSAEFASGASGNQGAPQASPASTAPTTAPTTTLPPRRLPSPEDPLRLWMGGDSMMGNVSQAVSRLVASDPRISLHTDVRVATGLARPDVLDWPALLAQDLAVSNAEVVVLFYGANDDQDMHADGQRVIFGTEPWKAEYARRVGVMLDIAVATGRTAVWIGVPVVKPPRLNAGKDLMNDAARAEAAKRPGVVFIDTSPLYAGADGGYSIDLATADGSIVRVRTRDGVHLTHSGADRLAPLIVDSFAADRRLR